MNQTQVRWAVWVLAILTCLAMGNHTAYADGNKSRVEAAGWYFSTAPPPPISFGGAEIKIGVTGKCDTGTSCSGGHDLGRFEYFNTVTGLRFHGKISSLQFHPNSCGGNIPLDSTFPAVTVSGSCDGDDACSFIADLVDGGEKKDGNGDWVCNLTVSGSNKNHTSLPAETESGQQLSKGQIKIRTNQP